MRANRVPGDGLYPGTDQDGMIYRQSRHAYGHGYQPEVKDRSYWWFIGAGIIAVVLLLVYAGKI